MLRRAAGVAQPAPGGASDASAGRCHRRPPPAPIGASYASTGRHPAKTAASAGASCGLGSSSGRRCLDLSVRGRPDEALSARDRYRRPRQWQSEHCVGRRRRATRPGGASDASAGRCPLRPPPAPRGASYASTGRDPAETAASAGASCGLGASSGRRVRSADRHPVTEGPPHSAASAYAKGSGRKKKSRHPLSLFGRAWHTARPTRAPPEVSMRATTRDTNYDPIYQPPVRDLPLSRDPQIAGVRRF